MPTATLDAPAPAPRATLDVLVGTCCELVPGQMAPGPGWYLIAANSRVECGPFPTQEAAERAAAWLEDEVRGCHPGPWLASEHRFGLTIGSRLKVAPRRA